METFFFKFFESRLNGFQYGISIGSFRTLFVIPDMVWKTKKLKHIQTQNFSTFLKWSERYHFFLDFLNDQLTEKQVKQKFLSRVFISFFLKTKRPTKLAAIRV